MKKKAELECPFCDAVFSAVPLCCTSCGNEVGHLLTDEGKTDRAALEGYRQARRGLKRSTWIVALAWGVIWGAIFLFLVV